MTAAIQWIKANPLKISGFCNIAGDFFILLAGTLHRDTLLSITGLFGLTGNLILLLWGKGGAAQVTENRAALWRKYLCFWRFPVEASAGQIKIAALLYAASGFDLLHERGFIVWPLVGVGAGILAASTVAIYWPQKPDWPKPLFVSGMILQLVNLSSWLSAITLQNNFLYVSATIFTVASLAMAFSNRHEN